MKRAFSMNNTACAACGYLVLIGFAFTLSGCVAPYYAARPAPGDGKHRGPICRCGLSAHRDFGQHRFAKRLEDVGFPAGWFACAAAAL